MSELTVGTISGLAANNYVVDVAAGSLLTQPGMVLQVVSTTKTDVFSTTSTSLVDITGFSATITPKSTSSKVLVSIDMYVSGSGTYAHRFSLLRDTTTIVQNSTNSYTLENDLYSAIANAAIMPMPMSYLDSPSSTSALTYKVQASTSAGTLYFNTRSVSGLYAVSTITLMEIAQ